MAHSTASYGSWQSPITSDLIVAQTVSLSSPTFDGNDIYWLEGRPQEKGRTVLVKRTPDGQTVDITPKPFNVRTRVHEYGGGSFLIHQGTVYFINFADQRLYQQKFPQDPQPITPENAFRYADFIFDPNYNRLIAVCEDHSNPESEPENKIVSINIQSGEIKTLVSGNDFYSSPRLSPDGVVLAWITWNHPNMPWDETQLCLAVVNPDGMLGDTTIVAGGQDESIAEVKWSPDGILTFSSDRSNWWNLYQSKQKIEPLFPYSGEFAYPNWIFGLSAFAFAASSEIICTYTQQGRWYLGRLSLTSKELVPISLPYTDIFAVKVKGNQLIFRGSSPTEAAAIVLLDLTTNETTILKSSADLTIDKGYLSIPEAIEFPTENGLTAYAWYYPPQNKDYTAPEGEKPPLLVKSHGGPTASASSSFSLRVQYWTSRGFGYLDVNYGGSTGFGREYRQRLTKNWGIVDVDDCINGANHLVKQGKVDSNKLAISGGSAGGYTTLAALTFHDTFKAGASYYGVSDLEALATDTHKFEARYLDGLIGKYPEDKEIYQKRSPIYYTAQLSCPIIFFQGLEDKVVPPNQAEKMVEGMKEKGIPVAYVPYEGEQHGFRQAENIKRSLDGEFYFYSQIFGFKPADAIEPIEIYR
ncbi:MAG: prolyl oligopeptidase family serine peptidase [Microcystaceae cyanobacterium]